MADQTKLAEEKKKMEDEAVRPAGDKQVEIRYKEAEKAGQPKLAEEMQKMEYEPLLPVEKKLIAWSLGLGTGLLIFLYWVSVTFFPTGH